MAGPTLGGLTVITSDGSGTEGEIGPCDSWADLGDICSPHCADVDPALLDKMLKAASGILFRRSGLRYSGLCTFTVRPCREPEKQSGRSLQSEWPSVMLPHCGCRGDECGCGGLSEVSLGSQPVHFVDQVWQDGALRDPLTYRLDNKHLLVSLDPDRPWPCCSAIPVPREHPDAFEITFRAGRAVPMEGVIAAAALACQLALLCSPGGGGTACLLTNVERIDREGVSFVMMPTSTLSSVPEVAAFLESLPPGPKRGGTIASPDVPRKFRRPGQ